MLLRLFALLFIAVASPAAAGGLPDAQSLNLVVAGSVPQHCALGSVQDMDFGNLERRGLRLEARVAFDCNVPFSMVITGATGALTHTTMPSGQGPYGGAVPYELGVTLPLRHPAVRLLSQTFASRQLMAGGMISSQGAIATDGMTLNIQLGRPAGEAGLLGGQYSETITISVSPL